VESQEKEKDKKEETPAATPSVAANSPRIAPSGPASWRSAQNQGPPQGQGQRNRERDDVSDRGDSKRTRLSSPPSGSTNSMGNTSSNGSGNANGNGRYPSRAEPPRRTLFLTLLTWTSSPRACVQTWKCGIK
jgi:hypothetical protein